MKRANPAPEKWALAVIVCLGVILTSAITHAASKTLIHRTVVTVNGEEITETEFLYFLMGKYGDDVTDQLIQHTYLSQVADDFNLTIDPQDGWDYMNERYTEEKLAALGEAFDLDIIAYSLAREVTALDVIKLKGDALIDELGLTATDDEILNYYLKIVDSLSVPESARIGWIITDDKAQADAAKVRLDGGEDFASVVKDVSIDEESVENDGEVGWIAKGKTAGLPQEIEDTVFNQNEGDHSDVLTVGENFFIVRTFEKQEEYEPTFEEMKPAIEDQLLALKIENPLKEWVVTLGEAADVEVIYPIFQDMIENGGMVPNGG